MAGVSTWWKPGSWLLGLLYFLASRASCGTIASWWTDPLGATLIVQDDETALIRYSLCNSNGTPVLPKDKSLTLPLLKYPPKNGTGLAGVGWSNGPVTTASIFYQDGDDEIINTVLSCDIKTGHWTNVGDYPISSGATTPSPTTSLAAVVLGEYAGYRVFYKDIDNRLRCLGYVPNGPWGDWGAVSNDEIDATAIGAAFTGSDNITVVTPKGTGNMEIAQVHDDGLWHIQTLPRPLSGANVTNATKTGSYAFDTKATLPFTLPAWEGTAAALGASVNEKGARSIFYLGTDGELYQVTHDDDDDDNDAGSGRGGGWKMAPRPGADAWPKADNPRGPLGVASHFGRKQVRVHYRSGGRMIEARGEGPVWAPAVVLPDYNSSAQNPDAPATTATAASAPAADAGRGGGLTTGAKIGIGVGVALGGLALAGMVGAFLFLRRRRKRRPGASTATAAGSTAAKSPAQSHHYPSPASYSNYPPPPPPHAPGVYQQQQHHHHHHHQPLLQQPPTWGYSPPPGSEKGTATAADDAKRPGELDGSQLYEMSEQRGRHEMMGEGTIQEAP